MKILYFVYTLYTRKDMQESVLFLHCQRRKKKYKKIDAVQFLDARGDEKQVINLEQPKLNKFPPN